MSEPTSVAAGLRRLVRSPRITVALRDAETLAQLAARSPNPGSDARLLRDAARDGDDLTALAALHAIGTIADPLADVTLLDVLHAGEEPFVGHAAWILAARRPNIGALGALLALAEHGEFSGMLAERTLIEWTRVDPDGPSRLARELLDCADHQPLSDRRHLRRDFGTNADSDGLVIVQPFLHARLDAAGTSLGAGDAGGIASLLRSLGTSLTGLVGVDEVITVTRAHATAAGLEPLSGHLAERHRIERIPFGPAAALPWRETWQYRNRIEQEMTAIGEQLSGRRVVWHLRMADVGTLAASAAARRLGQPVVFTAAPDPHIVIEALEADGRLDRGRFGIEDAASQYWFRARMVERLSSQVDRLALLPRPSLHDELVELVGLDSDDLDARSDTVPEGVDVAEIDAAIDRHRELGQRERIGMLRSPVQDPRSRAVADVLDQIPPERRHLPWVLSIGRLSPMKGPHRIAAAVRRSPQLADGFNVVLVGGDVGAPSPDERSTIELIAEAGRGLAPGAMTVVGHRPPAEICDLLVHGAASGAIYVCASDKEEFGLAIVEALAAGMVVVAPQRGGPRTYVTEGRNGVLCDTTSIGQLTAAIERAATLRNDQVRIERSRAQIRAELSVGRMAERLAELYSIVVPQTAPAA